MRMAGGLVVLLCAAGLVFACDDGDEGGTPGGAGGITGGAGGAAGGSGGTPAGGAGGFQPGGSGGQPVAGQPMGGQPVGGEPVAGSPMGGEPVAGSPMGGQPVGGEPVGGDPMGGETCVELCDFFESCLDDLCSDYDRGGFRASCFEECDPAPPTPAEVSVVISLGCEPSNEALCQQFPELGQTCDCPDPGVGGAGGGMGGAGGEPMGGMPMTGDCNGDCVGETICIDDICEPAYNRFYTLDIGHAVITERNADGDCWDGVFDCDAPDLRVKVFLNDEEIERTDSADGVFENTFDESFAFNVLAGSVLRLELVDVDLIPPDDVAASCENVLSPEVLRNGDLTCDGPNGSFEASIDAR